MHNMCGTLDAVLEVQRTIKTTKSTSFLCLLRKAIGPTVVHVENTGIVDGLWRGEMKCLAPQRRTRRKFTKKAYWWKVEHIKAHRSGKEKQQMSTFENFITEGQ